MTKRPVEVFWRDEHGLACVLQSTERGWEVALLSGRGEPIRHERVTNAATARLLAKRWRKQEAGR